MGYVAIKELFCKVCNKNTFHQVLEANRARPLNCRCLLCKNRVFEKEHMEAGYWDKDKRCVK